MNPDVRKNITSSLSELQLQFLQLLKIQPLHTDLTAPGCLMVDTDPTFIPSQDIESETLAMVTPEGVSTENADVNQRVQPRTDKENNWQLADTKIPLVHDLLTLLQQYDQTSKWYFQAGSPPIRLTEHGFFSAAPEVYLDADRKKQLWHELSQQLPADVPTESELI